MRKSINNLDQLSEFSLEVLNKLSPGNVCLLYGAMGMGKTTFVSLLMEHLKYFEVSSPTYSIVQEYESNPPVFHIDLYRVEADSEIELLDLEYYLNQKDHLVFIEWADRLNHVDDSFYKLEFSKEKNGNRVIEFKF
jgi:tRNA threonylcarbamoyladenosine biosynthesis protein TsaE